MVALRDQLLCQLRKFVREKGWNSSAGMRAQKSAHAVSRGRGVTRKGSRLAYAAKATSAIDSSP